RNLVVAGFFVAVTNEPFTLGGFLQKERSSALGTLLGNGFVPHNEVAIGVPQAAVEELAAFGTPLDQFAAASRLRTRDADSLRFAVFAFRIIAARNEFTESTFFQNHLRLTALRTNFIQDDIGLLRSLRAAGNLARRLAFRVTRASEELPETAPLQRHRLSAIFAGLRLGSFRGGFSFFRRLIAHDLFGVLAFGIR